MDITQYTSRMIQEHIFIFDQMLKKGDPTKEFFLKAEAYDVILLTNRLLAVICIGVQTFELFSIL